ncbi:hypothetical protein PPYR_06986 [Photinus pyralis]|uniref:Sphingomyelin phosphodiesterase n=2 Tax=Photinus pyralis TaxID=7054 RepID=A0A1Y1MVX1_PHOPY|nr:hypothetical protein PPYR_06986 [Photinus pyralis]
MFLERSAIFWCVQFAIYFGSVTHGNPIASSRYNFDDEWDSNIISNKEPLLTTASREHKLPPQSHRQGKDVIDLRERLLNVEELNVTNDKIGNSVNKIIPCSVCTLGTNLLQTAVRKGESFEAIKLQFVAICVGFEIQNHDVCTGIFDIFGPEVLAVLNVTEKNPKEICTLLQSEACEEDPSLPPPWTIELSEARNELEEPEGRPLQLGKPTLKILQISDSHLDLEYVEGSNANCDEPLCCRATSTLKKKNGVIMPAGRWGAFNCDSPRILVDNMLENIAKDHPDIDYIMWTGDLPPHDIWLQTKNDSLMVLKESVAQVQRIFPNTVILPALGNHEGIPAGNFPPPWNKDQAHSMDWLYNEVNKHWKTWLPESEENSILQGGFYSVLIRPGFRVISLNTNYCNIFSWWLLLNNTDPAKELDWLVNQLEQAENNDEKVHIIGHIPPGSSDCMKTWSHNFNEIVNRYQNVIKAQFYGHTHSDEFQLFYDPNNSSRPNNVAYVAPSVTPFSGYNPAYRIYHVDGEHPDSTWEVIDHETWIMDLDKANSNLNENPEWFKLYSAREAFDMPNLRPLEWHKLIYRMVQEPKLFEAFYKFFHRDSPVSKHMTNKEKLYILCDLKSGRSQTRRAICRDLEIMIHD